MHWRGVQLCTLQSVLCVWDCEWWVGDKGSPLPDFPHFLIGDEEQVELALAHSSNLLMWKIIVCIIDIKVMVNLLI